MKEYIRGSQLESQQHFGEIINKFKNDQFH